MTWLLWIVGGVLLFQSPCFAIDGALRAIKAESDKVAGLWFVAGVVGGMTAAVLGALCWRAA